MSATLPIGTRVRFLKTLQSGPNEDGPGNLYARKGDLGTVVEHPNGAKYGPPREGHWVMWDKWTSAPFGAVLGEEFEATED